MFKWLAPIDLPVGFVSSVIGIVSAVFAAFAWWQARRIRMQQMREERRRTAPISLILVNNDDQRLHTLSYHPRRDQATRAEIQGILSVYYGKERYDSNEIILALLRDGHFNRMISGLANELRFYVPADVFERFVSNDPPQAAVLPQATAASAKAASPAAAPGA